MISGNRLKDTLQKAVDKAIKNGWDVFGFKDKPDFKYWIGNRPGYKEAPVLFVSAEGIGMWDYRPTEVIYNHGFALAIWGKGYKNYLETMVTADDAFAYLAKTL